MPRPLSRVAATLTGAGLALLQACGVRRIQTMPTPGPALDKICADLHRLQAEHRMLLEQVRVPARYHRLQAVSWAYDAALCDACAAVGVPAPEHLPLHHGDRLVAEAQLCAAGVRW